METKTFLEKPIKDFKLLKQQGTEQYMLMYCPYGNVYFRSLPLMCFSVVDNQIEIHHSELKCIDDALELVFNLLKDL